MMLFFYRISNLLIGAKAVKLMLWEASSHTCVRRLGKSCHSGLVSCAALSQCEASVILYYLYGIVQGCVSGADCGTV